MVHSNQEPFLHIVQFHTSLQMRKQATVEDIIHLLNPGIRGWARYYSHCNATRVFSYVDHQVFKKPWRWCMRRHPDKGRHWVKERDFSTMGRRHWIFGEASTLYLVSAANPPITQHVKVKGYASPFDPTLKDYWNRRAVKKIEDRYWSRKKKAFLEEQGHRCWRCGRALGEEDAIHFHHSLL